MKRVLGVLLVAPLLAAAPTSGAVRGNAAALPAGVDMFIKIAGVDAPPTTRSRDGWIEIASLALDRVRVADCDGARRHGELEFGAVTFTTRVDAATPVVRRAAIRGQSFEEVKVTIREPSRSCELRFRRARFTDDPRAHRNQFSLGYMTYEYRTGARTD